MDLLANITKLNVDGNKIGVLKLPEGSSFGDVSENTLIRRYLVTMLKDEIDTLMLYVKGEDMVECLAFEPNHGEEGAITTVCGNGLKAISSTHNEKEFNLLTGAGVFKVAKSGLKTKICCGRFITSDKISRYFLDRSLKDLRKEISNLSNKYNFPSFIVRLGCNVENNNYIGEPHIVIGTHEYLTNDKLIEFANICGLYIRKSGILRTESNITFFSFRRLIGNRCFLSACTFERHLGDDPRVAITGSCGTGAMAASNVFYTYFLGIKPKNILFQLQFPAGKLFVEISRGMTFLEGRRNYENI